MQKTEITIDDFRDILNRMILGDRLLDENKQGNYLETLCSMEQLSDNALLQSKLYANLGLDSLDLWEMTCMLEAEYNVFIDDDVEQELGTGVSITVQKYLEAVNKHLGERI